jgi:4-carboxymuconolactone decarboxylase
MARVSFIEEADHPELAGLIARFKAGRGGRFINLYRALLGSPTIAAAWFDFNTAVRFQTALDPVVREIAILRVAVLNGAEYQLRIHGADQALKAGMTAPQVAALAEWQGSDLFTPRERAVLAYADAMTQRIDVADAIYDELGRHFSQSQIIELTVLIGAYNMHTRVSRALRLEPEAAGSP